MRLSKTCYLMVFGLGLAAAHVEAQGPPGGMPPPAVTLAPVTVKTVPVTYEYVGLTAASKTVEVRARITGFLETRDFQEGAYIEQGTKLFSIDPRSFKADQQIAAAQVEQAQARLDLAEHEVKRMQSVRQPGAISQSDLDQRISERASAAASLRLAKAQLAKADLELSYTTVSAPLTGFIGKALKEIGSLVDPNQNSLLAVMQQVDPLYVSFQVSENDYLAWKRAEKEGLLVLESGLSAPKVEITLLDGASYASAGVLDFVNVNLNTETGTVELRATFQNEDKILKPGQFVKVKLQGWQRPDQLTVPRRSVGQAPEGAYVYVVDEDQKAERRIVETGEWSEQDWIILEGLKEGEQVIVEGLTKVRPGSPVSTGAPGAPGDPAAVSGTAASSEGVPEPPKPAEPTTPPPVESEKTATPDKPADGAQPPQAR